MEAIVVPLCLLRGVHTSARGNDRYNGVGGAHDGAIRRGQVEKPHLQAELVRLDTGVSSLISHRLASLVDDPSRQNFGIVGSWDHFSDYQKWGMTARGISWA